MTKAQELTSLEVIEDWFSSKCDGDWEHQFGFTLESTDNPGWLVTLDMSSVVPESVQGWREGFGDKVEVSRSEGKTRIWSESLILCVQAATVLIIHARMHGCA